MLLLSVCLVFSPFNFFFFLFFYSARVVSKERGDYFYSFVFNIMPCSLVESYRRSWLVPFRRHCWLIDRVNYLFSLPSFLQYLAENYLRTIAFRWPVYRTVSFPYVPLSVLSHFRVTYFSVL
jgi:hypothetical protein